MANATEDTVCPVDLSAFTPGVTVTALTPGTVHGREITHQISRRLTVAPYGYNGRTVVLNDGHTVDAVLADSIAIAPDTLDYVPGDTRITYAEPQKGMRILINNAGGFNQNPGRYGYTETVVLDIETVDRGTYTSARVQTARYGWGCWEAADKRVKVRA